jgi:succinate-semialdehyde dehydrogenase/glutarate-semialdehyde dehydrogenase
MQNNYLKRKEALHKLAQKLIEPDFVDKFSNAYITDTSFTKKAVLSREIEVPYKLLLLPKEEESRLYDRDPIGTVVVFVPKNSIGLTLAKAIASSNLMGNRTRIYFPNSLKNTTPIYSDLLKDTLEDIEVIEGGISSAAFMRQSLKDPSVTAIVIYGDDSWIDVYRQMAAETKTKIIFEGPGNDPMIIFPDADISSAVQGAIEGGLNNGGQSCSALERFFVHAECYDKFSIALAGELHKMRIGSVEDMQTDIGPIASRAILSRMSEQIQKSREMGAVLFYGGNQFYDKNGLPILEPTILTNCSVDMPIVRDETFGPVFPLISFETNDELVRKLDQTKYGLNASSYGSTPEIIRTYLEETHRNVYCNSTAASSCNLSSRLMDGGFKRSGLIWDFSKEEYESTGRRILTLELSKPK